MTRTPLRLRRLEHVMGLRVAVDIRGAGLGPAVQDGFDWLRDVDRRFSPLRMDSEANRYDRGGVAEPSRELREVLNLAEYYECRSGGAFRARLPGRGLDLCGIVTGWAVQRFAEWLRAVGAENFRVDAGADVITAGEPEPGCRWRVGIRHPRRIDRMCAVLSVADRAVATSANHPPGTYIVDGRTGLAATELLSVTVVAADLAVADATATAAFAMGLDGIAWADAQPGCQVFAVTADGLLRSSDGMDEISVDDRS
jgi:thiamine biosynthesis lipoprotein